MPSLSAIQNGYGSDPGPSAPGPGEKGYRRARIAAMAGNVYKAGATAVGEIRESYAQTRTGAMDLRDAHGQTTIPGSFPDVAITTQGDDQMIIFPSYAKRHVKQDWGVMPEHHSAPHGAIRDDQYWKTEWERNQDEKAIVDVDVRGWIYSPHKGPMTRRNRILIGLARQLSGIPAPRQDAKPSGGNGGLGLGILHESLEETREREKIAKKAAEIERRGQQEKKVANRGDYSEAPKADSDAETESIYPDKSPSGGHTPLSAPSSPNLPARQYAGSSELTEMELTVANANLMARIAPFMTNPLVQLPITIFFYNDAKSQSRTVSTNDAGHFIVRAALDFVPTHIRVLANENLSAIQEIKVIEPTGVSLISDIDDTIKRSNIAGGAREIFRNTFVRDLGDLTVDGIKEWYGEMHAMGVAIHYCSNSPWQLFPVLASYFLMAGLPPGSLHLKQYSGMLQGIFEPVAERKKSTLERLMRDFPQRKFLLVGDSGEADLEVYTELAAAYSGRILAVFIRDVTTPEQTGFFDASFGTESRKSPSIRFQTQADGNTDDTARRPSLPARSVSQPPSEGVSGGPVMGNLIDFSDEPEQGKLDDSEALAQVKGSKPTRAASANDVTSRRPPPRPAKPASLRSTPSEEGGAGANTNRTDIKSPAQTLPPRARKPSGGAADPVMPHPLSQMQNSSQQTVGGGGKPQIPNTVRPASVPRKDDRTTAKAPPPPPPPRRAGASGIVSLSPRILHHRRTVSANGDIEYEPLPQSIMPPPAPITRSKSGTRSGGNSPSVGSPVLGTANKKVDLWNRRLARAQEILQHHGVALYTWRTGHDVIAEAVGIVKHASGPKKLRKKPGRFVKDVKKEPRKL